jgi:ATP-dependent RNA helicase DDX19/DBP5
MPATSEPRRTGLVAEESAKVEVEGDPHLRSAKAWDDLRMSKELLLGIAEIGFVRPSRIQEVALPMMIEDRCNLIAQAQNGSGKTATFALAILAVTDVGLRSPQAIVLSTTRELAVQNRNVILTLGKHTGIESTLCVPQSEKFPKRITSHVLVGTPGKMCELTQKRHVDPQNVHLFVLDEADVMVSPEQQMAPQVLRVRKFLRDELQILLFSATYPDSVKEFALNICPHARKITIKKEELTLSAIRQLYIEVDSMDKKYEVLGEFYSAMNVGQSIIFVNSRKVAFRLGERMQKDGHAVSVLTGGQKDDKGQHVLDPKERDRVMSEFRSGTTKVLVATDVLSRGIDVPQVTLVVNYGLPLMFEREGREGGDAGGWRARETGAPESKVEMETYLHRIGRTGRFGAKGIAINLVTSSELPLLKQIESYYAAKIEQLDPDPEALEMQLKKLR